MGTAARLSSVLALLTILLAIHPAVGRANCPSLGANQQCYDEPAVGQSRTNTGYTFPAGSHVKIEANGCEQTGGSGDTWKRYVNPDPWTTNPSEFYGLAGIYSSVGGATTLPTTRINSIQGAFYRVTTQSYLQVGFQDDDYSDNGYNDHDDGNGQCSWTTTGNPVPGTFYGAYGYGGPAYILLTVNPNAAPTVTADQPAAYVSGLTTLRATGADADGDTLTYHFLVDGQDASGAVSGQAFNWSSTGVRDGQYTLTVKASDPYTSTTSAGRTFNVDNTSPTVAITSGPGNQTFGPGSTQTWTFSASDGSGSGIQAVQCRVDGAPVTCKSGTSHSVSNLPGGTHTFSVQATDKVGHVSSVDSRTFAIDATPPETTVTAGPADGATTTDSTITYAFASSEPGSSFRCQVYADQPSPIKPGFTACSGGSADVISGLSPGAYVVEADAVDAYGNADPTPVVRHFTIAAPAAQGGTPTGGGGTPSGGGGTPSGGGGTPAAPVVPTAPRAKRAMHVTLAYAYSSPTRLTKLTLRHVPRGATVRVTCHGHCPKALHKTYKKRRVSGTLSLARLVRRGLKPGVRLSIVVSKPGWKSVTKTVRIRRGKAPSIR